MKSRLLLAGLILLLAGRTLRSQVTGDVIGRHGLGPGSTSPVSGALPGSCQYCHAPHSGLDIALWNQALSTQTYTPYTSTTETGKGNAQPAPGTATSLCLSCHDGTVAVGLTVVYGKIPTTGAIASADILGTNLQLSHPVSLVLPLKDSIDLVASLAAQGKTADPTGAVKLVRGNVECTSCHDPHVEGKDPVAMNFLVRDSSSGQMCLACHDPNRTITAQVNPLAGWSTSIHATSSSRTAVTANIGSYSTVALNACTSCHVSHNARGTARLLRGPDEQDCMACHGGGSNVSPAALNIFAEYAKTGHPIPSGNNLHDAAETAVLNNNRHATCVDCHNPHASNQAVTFTPPPAIRASETAVAGINALDGVSVLNPAINQYENCLRCHGTSAGKVLDPKYGYHPLRVVSAGDPLNLIPEFALTSSSSHPVTHDRSSPLSQPSLRAQMIQLDGITLGRSVGTRILCTDCHNSDDNREFGGAGPNGPHGSKWTHILERRYEFSQSAGPGLLITNVYPSPDLSVNGPFAMCAKCHDLNQILSNSSFTEHARHINDGFSCSACHTAHGMAASNASISGERLVNFDINVVAPSGSTPISYSRATNSCSLTCHNHAHSQPSGAAIRIKK
ncbi:MAG TPA: cytochrome c3 family protein [Candidatus Cybelea sp.]|nr:cytochrome c3 family protein [Candidatus Cybelea sp.]